MTTALAIASAIGAIVSWWHSRSAVKAAAQVEAGKKAAQSVQADLDAVNDALKNTPT